MQYWNVLTRICRAKREARLRGIQRWFRERQWLDWFWESKFSMFCNCFVNAKTTVFDGNCRVGQLGIRDVTSPRAPYTWDSQVFSGVDPYIKRPTRQVTCDWHGYFVRNHATVSRPEASAAAATANEDNDRPPYPSSSLRKSFRSFTHSITCPVTTTWGRQPSATATESQTRPVSKSSRGTSMPTPSCSTRTRRRPGLSVRLVWTLRTPM